MSGVEAVVFDWGHTLIDFTVAEDRLHESYEEIRGLLEVEAHRDLPTAPELVEHVSRRVGRSITESYEQSQLQELDIVALFDDALRDLGFTLTPALVQRIAETEHTALTRALKVDPHILPVLQALRARGLKIGLVSNVTFLGHMVQRDMERLGIAAYLDHAIYSSDFGRRKPDPAIFRHIAEQLGVSPGAVVFVGDRLRDDIAGAQAIGMRGVLTREFRQEEVIPEVAVPACVIDRLPDLLPFVDALLAQ